MQARMYSVKLLIRFELLRENFFLVLGSCVIVGCSEVFKKGYLIF